MDWVTSGRANTSEPRQISALFVLARGNRDECFKAEHVPVAAAAAAAAATVAVRRGRGRCWLAGLSREDLVRDRWGSNGAGERVITTRREPVAGMHLIIEIGSAGHS